MLAVYQRELLQELNTFHPGLFNLCQVILIIQTFQNLLMTSFGFSIFLFEVMQDITYTQTVTANLIGISRTDTFTRRAYFSITFRSFVSGVQYAVGRQDEMRFLRNMQARFQVMTGCFQCFSLCLEESRIKHHAITNDIHLVTLENSRGNRTEHILLPFELECMSGIRSALEASHNIVSRS